jgi:hypothetical protein
MTVLVPHYPDVYLPSDLFRVTIGSQAASVLVTSRAHFCTYCSDEAVDVCVQVPHGAGTASLSPARLGIDPAIDQDGVYFRVPAGENWYLQVDDRPYLYGFTSRPSQAPEGEQVRVFRAGQVYEIGVLVPKAGETIWIESGAVVRGLIQSEGGDGICIGGGGLLHGVRDPAGRKARPLGLKGGDGHRIEDVTVFSQAGWAVVPSGCRNMDIDNIHIIGIGRGHDGLDLVNCEQVRVRGGFFHSGDDCIVLKAWQPNAKPHPLACIEGMTCRDILVEGACLLNDGNGSNLEIGHELLTDRVGDIVFRDCDLLANHGPGNALSINNMGSSLVENIRFENLRVEHYYDRLVSLVIDQSRYSHTDVRGRIRDVLFKDIAVQNSIYNAGYSISLIGGYNAEHRVEDVRFDHFCIDGNKVASLQQLSCYVRDVGEISFC